VPKQSSAGHRRCSASPISFPSPITSTFIGAFGASLTRVNDAYQARLLTTAIFLIIRATAALEQMEQVSVGIKLSVIAGLLVGVGLFLTTTAQAEELVLNAPKLAGWQAVTLVAGLIVPVRGVETSRYPGETYDASTCIRSMKIAQGVPSVICLLHIIPVTYAFGAISDGGDRNLYHDLMEIVARILSALLVAAALSAQYSAAAPTPRSEPDIDPILAQLPVRPRCPSGAVSTR
jgi:hypothetical protein